MRVTFYRVGSRWTWTIYDSSKKPFCKSVRTYGRFSDARRSYLKLSRIF